jgi:putative heme transporter
VRTGASRPAWVARLGLLLVAGIITVVVVRLIGRVDWAEVWAALTLLTWWHPLVLLVVLLLRQVLNALPLALYIPGISPYQATLNDQAAILMASLAPPPSDLALRLSIFGSWGVPTVKALAGTVMNTLTFYVVRFAAPIGGFVLLGLLGRAPGPRWLELLSIAISLAILVGVLLVVRSEQFALAVGGRAGRAARRVRRSVDPEAWARSCAEFRSEIVVRFRRGFPQSLVALVGMLAVDLTLLVLCLRFVGLDSSEVALAEIAVAYLFAYPFTIFPFSGIGVVDALVLAGLVEAAGSEVEAAGVAGLVVWRVFTVGGPVLLGLGALAVWRRGTSASAAAPRPQLRP